MIVHQHDCCRRKLQSALHDFAHVNGRVVDRALLLQLVCDKMVLFVEKQNAKLLALFETLSGTQIVVNLGPR